MITIWYGVVSFMLITYVVLDGRNFGAGMLHWFVAKTPEERRQVVAAIGPLWSWHEVWLVGFGGTLLAVFPRLMSTAFAGYYLALFLILWCLLLRGGALEVGGHINDKLWQGFWDFVFVISSFLLAILFGVAGGNVARGVPLDKDGNFSMAFFTNFNVYDNVGLIDWYTLSVAIFAAVLLAAHGGTYLVLKTEGPVHDRSEAITRHLWLIAIPLMMIVSVETWFVRPDLEAHGIQNVIAWLGALLVAGAAFTLAGSLRQRNEKLAFVASNALIAGMLATGAAAIFPVMLYSTKADGPSLTAEMAASHQSSLFLAAIWWPVSFAMSVSYFVFISRHYYGKVSVRRDNQGFY